MYVNYEQIIAALVRDGIDLEKPDDQNIYRGFRPCTHVRIEPEKIFPKRIAYQVRLIGELLYRLHGQVPENLISSNEYDYIGLLKKKRPWVAVHLQDWIDEGFRQTKLDPKNYEVINGLLYYIDPEKVKKEQEQIDAMYDEFNVFGPHATLLVNRTNPEEEKE